ncbi:DUF2785 domain-containing protein [Cognaticolwellia mytili]|uniref:DUF2785 domain-containing protein n=1 Tax=Cognaticolwellia mytili TaxID=1888913 RepID=UPI000A1740CB|nr:DUF2785 domain-containing protein [Cognaticolwellia mytili]
MAYLDIFNKLVVTTLLYFLLLPIGAAYGDSVNANHLAKQCYTNEWNQQALLDLATRKFNIESDVERNELALQLVNCLAVPQSNIRDGVAYAGLSAWLRSNQLPQNTYQMMYEKLLNDFGQETIDDNKIYQPFITLMLAELARVDRKTPYLPADQRELLVVKSAKYMSNITDYRGFDNVVGWRHNVAHTADLFLQLALNPEINKKQLSTMLEAIGQQVLPKNGHFYTYGEPKRLVMPLLYIFLQEQHTEQDWKNWLQQYITKAPTANWQQTYKNNQGLANLHNAREFLNAMFVLIADSKNTQLQMLKPALTAAIKSLP